MIVIARGADMKISTFALTASLAAMVLPATSAFAADIDNTGGAINFIHPFGSPDTATYGQTFTAGAGDASISDFSMFLNGSSASLTFRGYIATWTGTQAGTLLYTSGDTTISSADPFQEFAFSPNLAVTAGQQYVAFLSISELGVQPSSIYSMPVSGGNAIADGGFVYFNNRLNFGDLFTQAWTDNHATGYDAVIKVNFSALPAGVPEPATWAMMIGGFGLVGGAMRRRKTRVTVSYA